LNENGKEESGDSNENQRYYRIKPGEETVIPDFEPESITSLGGQEEEKPSNTVSSDVPSGRAVNSPSVTQLG